jgi:hypothetical protein
MKDGHVKIGVWLVGARGSVATTAVTGAAAVRDGLVAPEHGASAQYALLREWSEGVPA